MLTLKCFLQFNKPLHRNKNIYIHIFIDVKRLFFLFQGITITEPKTEQSVVVVARSQGHAGVNCSQLPLFLWRCHMSTLRAS